MFSKANFAGMLAALVLGASTAHAAPLYSITALPANTFATAINNAGQVVGEVAVGTEGHAFIWAAGVLTDLGSVGTASAARAISNTGLVAGYTVTSEQSRAFLHDGNGMIPLGTLGGANSTGHGVNSLGQVVGQSNNADGAFRGFLYSGGTMTDLGTLGGDFSFAAAINSRGQVVGESSLTFDPIPAVHAFVYENGAMRDLGTLGGSISSATAINDLGQIAALGCREEGCQAVLLDLVPQIPEPASVLLMLAGLGVLAAGRVSAASRRA